MPQTVTHVIHVWLKESKKRFIGVSAPDLHVHPGDKVQWVAADGGPFWIRFDKPTGTLSDSPFSKKDIKTGESAIQVNSGTGGRAFFYTIELDGGPNVYLDPTLVVETP